MTRRTTHDLLAQANATLPDNTSELITAADVRAMVLDILDTLTPVYGGIGMTGSVPLALTSTPIILPFTLNIVEHPPDWVMDAAAGTLTRNVPASLPGVVSRFYLSGIFFGQANTDVTFQLFRNGAATPWRGVQAGRGTGRGVSAAFTIIDYTLDPVAVYDMRVSGVPSNNVTFQNVTFIGENIHLRANTPPPVAGGFHLGL